MHQALCAILAAQQQTGSSNPLIYLLVVALAAFFGAGFYAVRSRRGQDGSAKRSSAARGKRPHKKK